MSDTLPGTPGTGPVPEPEPEGQRAELVEAEEERRQQAADDAAQRSTEAKAFLSGQTDERPDSVPGPRPIPGDTPTVSTPTTSSGTTHSP